jgi:hypothetical protein
MATGKPARGSTHGPGGLWPCGLMDTGEQAQGTTPSRVADTHGPSWARGNDTKDASLLGKACVHRVGSIPGSDGKVHRFADERAPMSVKGTSLSLMDAPMGEKGASLSWMGAPMEREPRVSLADGRTHEREGRVSLVD